MSTRESTSARFPDRFRPGVGQRATPAVHTIAWDSGEATTIPDLSPRVFTAGDMQALIRALVSTIHMPVSGPSISAVLESQGWTDADAKMLFQRANLMELGQELWQQSWLSHRVEAVEEWSISPSGAISGKSVRERDDDLHLRGPYFLVIALLQIAGLALAGVSLGTGVGLNLLEATVVGMGLLLGLLWANAFSQPLARDPWSLHLQGDDVLAGLAAFRVIGLSIGLAVLAGGAVIAVIFAVTKTTPYAMGLGLACFLLIVLFWLLVNTLLAMGLGMSSIFAAGLALTSETWLLTLAPTDLLHRAAPVVGLALACVFMSVQLAAWWMVKRRGSRPNRRPPRLAGMVVDQFGYIVYGAGLMLLIILDRVVAWHVGTRTGWLAFQAPYEIGLGWALIAFLVAVVGQEVVLVKFLRWMSRRMAWHRLDDIRAYRRVAQDAYWSRLAIAFVVGVASGVLVAGLVSWVSTILWLRPILPVAEGLAVFRWGLIGYCLLSVAMFNSGLLVAASQPGRLILPLVLAVVVDLSVATTAALTLGYAYSVLGLVAGATVLLANSAVQVIFVLKTSVYGLP